MSDYYKFIDGIQAPTWHKEEIFRSALRYKPRPDDIFVVTYPKCGSTWISTIVLLIVQNGQLPTSTLEYWKRCPLIDITGSKSVEEMIERGPIRTQLPFHAVPWSKEAKYIYVARNPKDCCVSYYHFSKNFPLYDSNETFDQFFERFCSGNMARGDYFEHLLSWYPHRNESNVLFLTYEAVKEDTDTAILKIASFIDVEKYAKPMQRDPNILKNIKKYSSLQEMGVVLAKGKDEDLNQSSDEVRKQPNEQLMNLVFQKSNLLVRKGMIGDWRNYLSEDESRRLDEKLKEKAKSTDIIDLFKKYM